MEFVNPALLWGAALVAVPIVLHLLLRQKPRSLEFPALRLVARRREANRRKLRWRHWLLLLLRCAAIALLALAFARPTIKSSGAIANQALPVAAALVFDTSPRMEYRFQNQSRLAQAQDIAHWLLGQLPADSQVGVLESSLGSAVFQVDLAAALARVDRLQTTWQPQPLTAQLEAAVQLLAGSELDRKELYVFTDLAAAQWNAQPAPRLKELLSRLPGLGVYLIDVGQPQPRNLTLGTPQLNASVLTPGATLHIDAPLAAQGLGGSRTVELYLASGDAPPEKRHQAMVEVPENGSAAAAFSLAGLSEGLHQGHLRVLGEDGIAWDDIRYFTVQVRRPWPVRIVAAAPEDQTALFLAEALAPAQFRTDGRARFVCETVDWEAFRPEQLTGDAAVCLVDPPPLQAPLWNQLQKYVASGGGLAIFLGPAATPLEAFNAAAPQELLPAPLRQQARWPDGDQYLAPSNLQHPILARFRNLDPGPPWDLFSVYRHWQLGELHSGASTVITYRDGEPALVERPIGQGRTLTFTTSIAYRPRGKAWNLLPELDSWPFVVLTNEMLLYLVGNADDRLQYEPGQTALVRPERGERITSYLLVLPDGQRTRRTADASQASIAIAETDEPGQYRLESGGAADGFRRGFSVNVPPAQSDLARATPEMLKALLGDTEFRVAANRTEINRTIAVGRVGRELFGWIIVGLVLVMALEHWLSNRFYREPAGAGTTSTVPVPATAS
ncbi:MAG: BatA and WFA domain-containing protein [Pirellulales bacterium]|nr:BatA and WFA domain-containing protein [Pirellulales bacterium]